MMGIVQYIPIDSKFPTSEFINMTDALVAGDKQNMNLYKKRLEARF